MAAQSDAVRELIGCADTAADDLLSLADDAEAFMDSGVLALYRDAAHQLSRAVARAQAEAA